MMDVVSDGRVLRVCARQMGDSMLSAIARQERYLNQLAKETAPLTKLASGKGLLSAPSPSKPESACPRVKSFRLERLGALDTTASPMSNAHPLAGVTTKVHTPHTPTAPLVPLLRSPQHSTLAASTSTPTSASATQPQPLSMLSLASHRKMLMLQANPALVDFSDVYVPRTGVAASFRALPTSVDSTPHLPLPRLGVLVTLGH
jgi:hypothetical protein